MEDLQKEYAAAKFALAAARAGITSSRSKTVKNMDVFDAAVKRFTAAVKSVESAGNLPALSFKEVD